MIIKAFSEYIKEFDDSKSATVLLVEWLKQNLSKSPEDNIKKVIHKEIAFINDENGEFKYIGKSKSGQVLLKSLYNFALSYEQQKFTRWVHKLKASDFNQFF